MTSRPAQGGAASAADHDTRPGWASAVAEVTGLAPDRSEATLPFREEDVLRAACKAVCAQARDVTDARELLTVLGLIETPPSRRGRRAPAVAAAR